MKLDGDVGVLGNGAGLTMSTVDVVTFVGGRPANFCDLGGGGDAQGVVDALEVITRDEQVRLIFFNIFGGITRCDEVARGILQAVEQMGLEQPIVVRLDGTNAEEGRRILETPRSRTCTRRRRCSTALAARWSWRPDGHPRRRGDPPRRAGAHRLEGAPRAPKPLARHRRRRGSHPGQGRAGRRGHPVFDTVAQAVSDAGANTAMVFVPAPFAADAMYEAIDAGIGTVICITEGVPAHEMLRLHSFIQGRGYG